MKILSRLLIICAGLLIVTVPTPVASAQTVPQQFEITARRFAFTPAEITVKKGRPVVLVLRSEDVTHGLRLRDFNVNVQVKAGTAIEVKFTPDKTGDFNGHCSVFCGSGHGTMEFTVHVVE
jgi:cytochrome c oxidase subunit II